MSRLSPKIETLRALFARSGNQCAFPNCNHSLINRKNEFIAQVCHIEGANEGGERYNENSNDEERRSFDNLLILCYAHHIETNDIAEYTVERLKEIKYKHEKSIDNNFNINEMALRKLSAEIEDYWNNLELLNQKKHYFSDLAFQININDTFSEVVTRLLESLNFIQSHFEYLELSDASLATDVINFLESKQTKAELINIIQSYRYDNPFINRNWETFNLAIPNIIQQLNIDIVHIEINYLEEYLKNNSNDQVAIQRFERIKKQLNEYAVSATYND